MKRIILTGLYLIMLLTACSQKITSKQKEKAIIQKGYLLIAGVEEIVFFPDSTATGTYDLRRLEKLYGAQIRTNVSYELYKLKQIADTLTVKMTFVSSDGSSETVDYDIQIIPVKIKYYEYVSQLPNRESGIGFEYNGRRYSFRYYDDLDASITKFTPLNKEDLKKFNNYKE